MGKIAKNSTPVVWKLRLEADRPTLSNLWVLDDNATRPLRVGQVKEEEEEKGRVRLHVLVKFLWREVVYQS